MVHRAFSAFGFVSFRLEILTGIPIKQIDSKLNGNENQMRREDIAWDYLTDIQRVQLTHFYPELAEENHKVKQDAGRLGGISTLMKYGNGHFSEIGAKGGRPKAQTLSSLSASNKEKEESYPAIKRLRARLKGR